MEPRTTYGAWKDFFSTRTTQMLLRQYANKATLAEFDRLLCRSHFIRALEDELRARLGCVPDERDVRVRTRSLFK